MELSQALCINIAGAISGHCWLPVQLQFSEQTFYFSGLLWEHRQLSGWTIHSETSVQQIQLFFFFLTACEMPVIRSHCAHIHYLRSSTLGPIILFIFLSLIATSGRLLTGIAISKIGPNLSAILICVPVQSPSICSSVWLRNSQPLSHYVHSSSCVWWDKLCFLEACMTFL